MAARKKVRSGSDSPDLLIIEKCKREIIEFLSEDFTDRNSRPRAFLQGEMRDKGFTKEEYQVAIRQLFVEGKIKENVFGTYFIAGLDSQPEEEEKVYKPRRMLNWKPKEE